MQNKQEAMYRIFVGLLLFAGLTASSSGLASGFQVPSDYGSRFTGTTLALGGYDEGFGVRGFPLPIQSIVRFGVVRHRNYWEYLITARIQDTTLTLGRKDSGEAAKNGTLKAEFNHDPSRGIQMAALVQEGGDLSRVSLGYAWTGEQNRVRLATFLGYGVQRGEAAPYIQIDSRMNDSAALPDKAGKLSFNISTKTLVAPTLGKAQFSVDAQFTAALTPAPDLTINLGHLERLVFGDPPFPSMDLNRYNSTTFNATYRFRNGKTLSQPVGAISGFAQREWYSNTTQIRSDLLFNIPQIPFLVGPRFGYQWGASQKSSYWIISFATQAK